MKKLLGFFEVLLSCKIDYAFLSPVCVDVHVDCSSLLSQFLCIYFLIYIGNIDQSIHEL